VQTLVVDEADTMFDAGFGPDLFKVLAPLKGRGGDSPPLAAVLVSATLSAPVKRLAEREFPGMVVAETASLHKGISGSNHTFVPMAPGRDRLDALAQARPCPTRCTCCAWRHVKSVGVHVLHLHAQP
jgi:superfamily II DNA/RNA helicase